MEGEGGEMRKLGGVPTCFSRVFRMADKIRERKEGKPRNIMLPET